MSESLDGRVAIGVGATSGMGRATAMELARCGAVVTAAGRREAILVCLDHDPRLVGPQAAHDEVAVGRDPR